MQIKNNYTSCRLKNYAKICNGQDYKSVYDENGQYPVMGSGGEFSRANTFLYSRPSVLLGRKGTIDKPLFVDFPFWTVDTMYYTEIYENTYPKFFYYLCTTIDFQYYQYGSAVPSMTQRDLNEVSFPFVQYLEQQRIADFLDAKCTHIDDTIIKEKELIEKLKEYRQSVITEAVTKGLDEGVAMKDSGVEWIGEIPEHWEVLKLKNIVKTPLQYGANASGISFSKELARYIRITDISASNELREDGKLSLENEIAQKFKLKHGDILFARSGATVGKTFLFKEKYGKCAFAGYLIKATIKDNCDYNFIFYFTLSSCYNEWKNRIFIQATIQNIGANKYNALDIPIPPILQEQQEIADYLDKKTTLIDHAINQKEQLIEKLNQYKKSLIYETVTGKVEVEKCTIEKQIL